MKMNNYDAVAPFYDKMSRLVFGQAQVNAQVEQLKHIPAGSKILLVGGGTGWILEEITKVHHAGLAITYVEISEKMLELARRKCTGNNKVCYVHSAIEDFKPDGAFDVIHTAFLFDNFSEERTQKVFTQLDILLQENGYWLFSDFKVKANHGIGWKQFMLSAMYLFFGLFARVEARKLQDLFPIFKAKNYQIISRKAHYRGFIESIIFRKSRNFHTFI